MLNLIIKWILKLILGKILGPKFWPCELNPFSLSENRFSGKTFFLYNWSLHGEGDELLDALVHVGRRQVDVDRHLPHQALPHSHARAQGNLENYQSGGNSNRFQ